MGFLDNLGKKATEATAKAAQKAKELSETARLNSLISEEEKSITNNYYQIGKLYASLHQQDCEEDFAGMLGAINESEEKIKSYRKQIQDIKGVLRCENCGAEVPRGVAFCSSCGTPMSKRETDEDHVRCENCGASVKRGMRFCTSCGKPMTQPIEKQGSPDETSSEEKAVERICPNCGAKAESDTAFCTECGTKL